MNLTRFLLIDAFFILICLPLILVFQSGKAKSTILESLKGNASENLPCSKRLAELEKLAKRDGSGIEHDSLIGLWKFFSVWKQNNDSEDLISSSLLRLFVASLEIKKDQSNKFFITNSIQFGTLLIRFSGYGKLKGKQPLLPFYFDSIELKVGANALFTRSLEIPEENNMPFFGLIAIEENGKWLSARGRGGGLALWVKGSN